MRKKQRLLAAQLVAIILVVSSLLALAVAASAAPPPGSVQLIIKFKASATDAAKDAAIRGAGATGLRDLPQLRTRVVSIPASAGAQVLAALANNPSVERAATAVRLTKAGAPNDPGYAQQWALSKVAWDQVYGSVPISGSATIAVLDTGVDATHPDLSSVMAPGYSAFAGSDPNTDPNGHGTALAGIAAASVNNGTGMAGVAYAGATVSSVQVLGADGTGLDSDVIAGVT